MPEIDQYEEEISAIASLLPEEHEGQEHRKNALTRADLVLIARLIKMMRYTKCSMGLDEEEVILIKKAVKALNRVLSLIGLAVVTGILALATGMFNKGFWATIATKIGGVTK